MKSNISILKYSDFVLSETNIYGNVKNQNKLPKEAYTDKYNWPYPPKNLYPLSLSDAERLYGKIEYRPKGNGKIVITNNFYKENIVETQLPQINKLEQPYGTNRIHCHKLAQKKILGLWQEWENYGLLSRILTFNGCFNARFERGGNTLSTHAFGVSFDINAKYNELYDVPPPVGEKGSVRELVSIANKWGFFWGGHYTTRKDGMHFELSNPYA